MLFEAISHALLRKVSDAAKGGHSVGLVYLFQLGHHDQVAVGAHVERLHLVLGHNALDVLQELCPILRVITPLVDESLAVRQSDFDCHMHFAGQTLVVEVGHAFSVLSKLASNR